MIPLFQRICFKSFIILFVFCTQLSTAPPESTPAQKDSAQAISSIDSTIKQASPPPSIQKQPNKKDSDFKDWIAIGGVLVGLGGLLFGIYQYRKNKEIAKNKKLAELEAEKEFEEKEKSKKEKTSEEQYRSVLKDELGSIRMLGSPDIESISVKLDQAFVSLRISESWRSEQRFDLKKMSRQPFEERTLTPEKVMQHAFQGCRLLLIIGDPGSGKTTLLKYYAICCLSGKSIEFGLDKTVLPIFFPLRELAFKNGRPESLPESLARWSQNHLLEISAEEFQRWFHRKKTLILLDGLDEISDLEKRRKVCGWIKNTCAGLKNAYFVVTARWTGYRKSDHIELECDHLRADVMDFTLQQQAEFLTRWFRAVHLNEVRDEQLTEQQWRERQTKRADKRAGAIIDFLKKEHNRSLQQLAAVPMLLQIMAIIWKDREHLPQTRAALYDVALNYLLDYRDRRKNRAPVLPAEKARRVLSPTALWMQEELGHDEVPKNEMHSYMQPILQTMDERPPAETFCANLRDRAGLIADYGQKDYIFRHKSFREFLAGLQLLKESHQTKRIQMLISHFTEDWWEESLRFFMSKSDDEIFDRFMQLFFGSPVSQQLEANKQTLLQTLVQEAPQKKINGLEKCLNNERLNKNQRRYVIDSLRTIGSQEAIKSLMDARKTGWDQANLRHVEDIIAETTGFKYGFVEKPGGKELFSQLPPSFRNPFEDNLDYILIPGGSYKYSVTGKQETVLPVYFAKYPLTNKRYRRFIEYLEGKKLDSEHQLSRTRFTEKLLQFAEPIEDYIEYLSPDPQAWPDKLRSSYDDDKRFKGDDQPVVGVSWFAARAYCFWLSCLQAIHEGDVKLQAIDSVASIYRLPTEVEWEWAAAGREKDGSLREYPWPKNKGKPDQNLANYDQNVGATTPVGRYPQGATPEGLLDMAGNVWEWMGNWYSERKTSRALRGGSWNYFDRFLRCSSRLYNYPVLRDVNFGFRVVRSRSRR